MSTDHGKGGDSQRAVVDRWAAGREALRAADNRMAALVEAEPELDPPAPDNRALDGPLLVSIDLSEIAFT